MEILLIEDDELLAQSLKDFLESEGFKVDVGYDAEEALNLTFDNRYDLYLFDINLGGESGLQIAKELKEADDKTPVIFITALTDLESISQAFNLGAVDYIKKPFHPQELILRIHSKFGKPEDQNTLKYGVIELDLPNRLIKVRGEPQTIGEIQFKILQKLLENKNSIVTKEELLSIMRNPSDVALRVTINKLKNRFELPIKNIRSRGYILE